MSEIETLTNAPKARCGKDGIDRKLMASDSKFSSFYSGMATKERKKERKKEIQ